MAQAYNGHLAAGGAQVIADPFAEAVARARPATTKMSLLKWRIRPAVPTEQSEQRALFRWASYAVVKHPELHDLYAIPNAGGFVGGYASNMQRVQAMKLEGVKAGVPDICLPHARGQYHSLYIELKRIGATASAVKPRQRDWHQRLQAAGHDVAVCLGAEAAKAVILAYLALPTAPQRLAQHGQHAMSHQL